MPPCGHSANFKNLGPGVLSVTREEGGMVRGEREVLLLRKHVSSWQRVSWLLGAIHRPRPRRSCTPLSAPTAPSTRGIMLRSDPNARAEASCAASTASPPARRHCLPRASTSCTFTRPSAPLILGQFKTALPVPSEPSRNLQNSDAHHCCGGA